MNIQNVELKYTVGLISQIPKTEIKQIILSGRSNVGKSSLINSMLMRNKLARVSSVPGKTITINYYLVDGKFFFTDLPGYGFAKRPIEEKNQWSGLVEGYFQSLNSHADRVAAVIQLIDLKVGPTADDIQMLEYLNYTKLPYIIVATKSDKLNKTQKQEALNNLYSNKYIKNGTKIIPFSATKKEGISELWNEIKKII